MLERALGTEHYQEILSIPTCVGPKPRNHSLEPAINMLINWLLCSLYHQVSHYKQNLPSLSPFCNWKVQFYWGCALFILFLQTLDNPLSNLLFTVLFYYTKHADFQCGTVDTKAKKEKTKMETML